MEVLGLSGVRLREYRDISEGLCKDCLTCKVFQIIDRQTDTPHSLIFSRNPFYLEYEYVVYLLFLDFTRPL